MTPFLHDFSPFSPTFLVFFAFLWIVAMARSMWVLLGLILMVVVGAAVTRVATTRNEERATASGGVGRNGGDDAEMEAAGGDAAGGDDDGGDSRGANLEEGEASGIAGGEDNTFQDLSELSGWTRPSRHCQGTLFELYEAERVHRRQSGKGTSAPVTEEKELGSNDDEDANFDVEADPLGEEEEQGDEDEDEAQEDGVEE